MLLPHNRSDRFNLLAEAIRLHLHTHDNMMRCSACRGNTLLTVTAEHTTIETRESGVWPVALSWRNGMEHCYLKPVSNLKKLHLLNCHSVLLQSV